MKIKSPPQKKVRNLSFIGIGIFLIIFSAILIKRCSEKKHNNSIISNEVLSWIGKELYIPKDSSLIINKLYEKKNLTIISFIDGNCSICINDLIAWKAFIEEMKALNNIDYIFIVNTIDYDGFSNYVKKEINFPFTLVNDENNSFVERNKLSSIKFFQTFLIDDKNVIILCGNPIYNQKLKQLYKTEIQKNMRNKKYADNENELLGGIRRGTESNSFQLFRVFYLINNFNY